jgi:hypothetical protein
MRSRRGRLRLLGAALALYGTIGIVMFIVIAVGVARPLERARTLSESVDQERTALVDSLSQAETTIRGMSGSVERMDVSLADAKTAIDQATTISHSVAQSMYGLRDAMSIQIPILGGQPLLGLAGNFDTTGQNLDQLGDDVANIGVALNTNRTDVATTSQNMIALADSVARLTQSVRDGPALTISTRTLDAVRLAVYAVTAWLVLFAVGCILAGLYLINLSRRPTTAV